jgi:taurine dioxygenase
MASITVQPLTGEHPFGARIGGVDHRALGDEGVRRQIRDTFDDRGMIVFEDIEQTDAMQVALSGVFGPPRDYAIKGAPVIKEDSVPGVVDFGAEAGKATVYDIGGTLLAGWVNWHFDACYTDRLNRAGLLRLTVRTPELGLTGFADGIQVYDALSPEWRARAEAINVVYQESLMFDRQRFGVPANARLVSLQAEAELMIRQAEAKPRAIHPAVWQRSSGEKVLHLAPWQAMAIEGREDAEGGALLAALWDEVLATMNPYWHKWQPGQMVIWDNWRFVHSVSGHDPKYPRNARRTTIDGDYGLGRFEGDPVGAVA